jgi:hypothetical protein
LTRRDDGLPGREAATESPLADLWEAAFSGGGEMRCRTEAAPPVEDGVADESVSSDVAGCPTRL